MPSQWERPNFDPHSSESRGPIDLKLKFKKHVRGTTPHAKYGKDRIKGVGGANTQFVTTLVLPFFCILRTLSWPYRWNDCDAYA